MFLRKRGVCSEQGAGGIGNQAADRTGGDKLRQVLERENDHGGAAGGRQRGNQRSDERPLRSTTMDAATTMEAVIAIFNASPYQNNEFPGERSFHGQPLPHHINHQVGDRLKPAMPTPAQAQIRTFGGEIEHQDRDGETAQPDHGIGHDGGGGRPTHPDAE